ncbi:hypothetical protein T484DRAFT_1916754 [Baffinella frigidus]|nr:hypothetical protein T484DRAFT_1916754 [Cryptophyta sp. CCMP2293]
MDGDTPLHMFASHLDSVVHEDGSLSAGLLCIHKLLAKGVPLECKNKAGMTAMDEAVTAGLPSVVGLLENEERHRGKTRNKCMAFAMGLDDRLGEGSLVRRLDAEVVCMVLGFMGARTPAVVGGTVA